MEQNSNSAYAYFQSTKKNFFVFMTTKPAHHFITTETKFYLEMLRRAITSLHINRTLYICQHVFVKNVITYVTLVILRFKCIQHISSIE